MALIASITCSSSSAAKRATWSTGPKFSRCRSAIESISMIAGATKVPRSQLGRQLALPDLAPGRAHRGDVAVERGLGLGVDHRADIGGEVRRIADHQRLERAADHRQHGVGDVVLQVEHAQRAAALAGALERAELITSRVTCSGSAELSTISAFCPPVSAISMAIGASRAASARLIARAVSVEPVKATPAMRGSRGQRGADLAVAGRELEHVVGNAGLVAQPDRQRGDQRGLLGGLGDHRVARGERGGGHADEDRQREVPRADRREHAAAVEAQQVLLAGRAGQRLRRAEQHARLAGVVAQEIDRLAQLEHRVGQRLARLALAQDDELGGVGFEQVRRP